MICLLPTRYMMWIPLHTVQLMGTVWIPLHTVQLHREIMGPPRGVPLAAGVPDRGGPSLPPPPSVPPSLRQGDVLSGQSRPWSSGIFPHPLPEQSAGSFPCRSRAPGVGVPTRVPSPAGAERPEWGFPHESHTSPFPCLEQSARSGGGGDGRSPHPFPSPTRVPTRVLHPIPSRAGGDRQFAVPSRSGSGVSGSIPPHASRAERGAMPGCGSFQDSLPRSSDPGESVQHTRRLDDSRRRWEKANALLPIGFDPKMKPFWK